MHTTSIKIIFRRIVRSKLYSGINILGLAMGIAAFLLLLEYISLEKSVNAFHKEMPQLFRLLNEDKENKTWAQVEPGWALQAKQRFGEINGFCRFEDGVAQGIVSVKNDPSKNYREEKIGYAEGNFFSFFSFPLKSGSAAAFDKPNSVFISNTTAVKYFAGVDPIGKLLTLHNQFGTTDYNVEGVFEDIGDNSDIRYDMLFSYNTLQNESNLNQNSWAKTDNLESQYIYTYFNLNKGTNIPAFEKKLNALRDELKKDKDGVRFRLQRFSAIHLGDSVNDNFETFANIRYIYMLAAIAFMILLIAWFNYINLSTASSIKRANEVGVRKVVGASRRQLVMQFLIESLLINFLALLLAVLIIALIQPLFNKLVDKNLSLLTLANTNTWLFALLLLLSGSVASGAYTAFALSKFNPIATLKGKLSKTASGVFLRRSLVVSQFVISIGLIIATIFIYAQLAFMQNKKLGINTDQMMVIRGAQIGKDSTYANRRTAFLNTLAGESFINDYCVSGAVPGKNYNFSTSGFTQPGSKKGDELKEYAFAQVSEKYFPVYAISFAAGRNFTAAEVATDWNANSKIIMNETGIKALGFTDPEAALRTKIQWDERPLEIVGVVKDYNHASLQNKVAPMIFYPNNNSSYITIHLTGDKLQDKIARIEKLYKSSFSGNPFDYFFLDENFNKAYAKEKQYATIFYSASIWAIFIACLGLFGLVTFTVESRVKEIGIRKILGADVKVIVALLSKDFLWLVGIAFLIAAPLAWYGMQKWLEDFAYKISGTWWIFMLAGVLAMVTALITVSIQAIKAAVANPVKNLRIE